MKKNSNSFRIIKGLFCIFILCLLLVGIFVLGVMTNIIDHRDSMKAENNQIAKLVTIEDKQESLETLSKFDKQNESGVYYKDIPKDLIDAVISIEDKRFMEHGGIDYKRTMGAIFSFIKNKGDSNYGGSTITQQLVKISTGDDDRSPARKIREWFRAIYIENKLSKEHIIKTYLNTIYLGSNNYGISCAAKDFFDKEVESLTLAESSTIAATIQSPEGTNPYKDKEARDRLLIRKDVVLKEMYDLGKISKEEYNQAINEEIVFARKISE